MTQTDQVRLPYSEKEKMLAWIEWYQPTKNDNFQTPIEDMKSRGHAQKANIKGESQYMIHSAT